MIVVFGSINVDLIFRTPKLPRPGETVLSPSYRVAAGGKGLNQAMAAGRAAPNRSVRMIGKVGPDSFAEVALADLKEAGVDVDHVSAGDALTGCAAICVDDGGENQILVASGANLEARADQVGDDLLGPETVLVLQMEVPLEENWALIARAHERGARTILNLAPAAPAPAEALRLLDVVVLNEIEAAMLAEHTGIAAKSPEAIARALAAHHELIAIVSLGADGALAAERSGAWKVGALAITAIDTVGAGDAFVGALAVAFDAHRALPEALRFASVAGGLACLTEGAAPAMPSEQDIKARLPDLAPPVPL